MDDTTPRRSRGNIWFAIIGGVILYFLFFRDGGLFNPPDPVGTIVFGDSVTGEVSNGEQGERWTFEGETGQRVTIRMTGDFDTYLELLSPNGTELTSDDDSGGNRTSLINSYYLPDNGTYTIIARGYNDSATGAYELSLSRGGTEALPTLAMATAAPIPTNTQMPTSTVVPSLARLRFGDTIEGEFTDTDGDVYAFNVRSTATIAVRLQGNFTPTLELYSPTGLLMTQNTGSAFLGAGIDRVDLFDSGQYTLVVRGGQPGDSYVLTLAEGSRSIAADQTPDGTSTLLPVPEDTPQPNELRLNREARGTTTDAVVGDRWTFEGEEGDVISLSVEADNDEYDTYLELLDENGRVLAFDDDSGTERNSTINAYRLPADGTYLVAVRGWQADDVGAYTLTLERGELPVTNTAVPTSTITPTQVGIPTQSARGLGYGDVVEGDLLTDQSQTWIFEGREGDSVIITMSSTDSSFDSVLELQDSSGNQLARNDDYQRCCNSRIDFVLPRSGSYRIIAGELSGDAGHYTLTLDSTGSVPTSTPGGIGYGDSVQGVVGDASGDIWIFEGREGDVVTISMNASEDGFDTYLELFDTRNNRLEYDDDGGDSTDSLIETFTLPRAGGYRIIARGYNGDTGAYTLSLELDEQGADVSADLNGIGYGDTVEDRVNTSQGDQWVFEGRAGDLITIEMSSSDDDFDSYLELQNQDGDVIAYDDDGAGYPNARIEEFSLPRSGSYTIVAREYGRDNGPYTLTLILVEASEAAPEVPVLPESGNIIGYGTTYMSNLTDGEGLIAFEGAAGDAVTITVTGGPFGTGEFNPQIELIAPGGDVVASRDENDQTVVIRDFALPEDGLYAVRIVNSDGDTGMFSLELALDEPDIATPTPTRRSP